MYCVITFFVSFILAVQTIAVPHHGAPHEVVKLAHHFTPTETSTSSIGDPTSVAEVAYVGHSLPLLRPRICTNTHPAQVYVCEHVDWAGNCTHIAYPLNSGECVALDGKASSIGPDEAFACNLYKYASLPPPAPYSLVDRSCRREKQRAHHTWTSRNSVCRDFTNSNDTLRVKYPGYPNLMTTDNGNWNDVAEGIQCFKA